MVDDLRKRIRRDRLGNIAPLLADRLASGEGILSRSSRPEAESQSQSKREVREVSEKPEVQAEGEKEDEVVVVKEKKPQKGGVMPIRNALARILEERAGLLQEERKLTSAELRKMVEEEQEKEKEKEEEYESPAL